MPLLESAAGGDGRRSEAAAAIAVIEGLLLVRHLNGADAADRAMVTLTSAGRDSAAQGVAEVARGVTVNHRSRSAQLRCPVISPGAG